jgi:hypothetical protein
MTRDETIALQVLLGASPDDLQAVLNYGSLDDCNKRLDEIKRTVNKKLRYYATHLHPDINPDPEANEFFKQLVDVANEIKNLKINRRQAPKVSVPVVRQQWVVIKSGGSGYTSTTSSTSTSTSNYGSFNTWWWKG